MESQDKRCFKQKHSINIQHKPEPADSHTLKYGHAPNY